jgi:hypothetical protein
MEVLSFLIIVSVKKRLKLLKQLVRSLLQLLIRRVIRFGGDVALGFLDIVKRQIQAQPLAIDDSVATNPSWKQSRMSSRSLLLRNTGSLVP